MVIPTEPPSVRLRVKQTAPRETTSIGDSLVWKVGLNYGNKKTEYLDPLGG